MCGPSSSHALTSEILQLQMQAELDLTQLIMQQVLRVFTVSPKPYLMDLVVVLSLHSQCVDHRFLAVFILFWMRHGLKSQSPHNHAAGCTRCSASLVLSILVPLWAFRNQESITLPIHDTRG